jgi:hypothetical protein
MSYFNSISGRGTNFWTSLLPSTWVKLASGHACNCSTSNKMLSSKVSRRFGTDQTNLDVREDVYAVFVKTQDHVTLIEKAIAELHDNVVRAVQE